MIRSAVLLTALVFTACSQQPAESQTPPERPELPKVVLVPEANVIPTTPTVAAVGAPKQPATTTPTQPTVVKQPDTPPTVFEYPTDLAGQSVVKAVTPAIPVLAPGEKFGATPRPRTAPTKILEPEPVSKASYVPPPILPTKPTEVKPTAPVERIPVDLGLGADGVPAKPTLPVAVGNTERARDVNLPPPLPTLGRPLNERVSLDDPTAEFGTAAIAAPPVKVTLAVAGFLKLSVPDPFEFGEQVKPKVPPSAEPGLTPVPVNPQRIK